MNLEQLNQLPEHESLAWFQTACAAINWCQGMTKKRPYSSLDELKNTAKTLWESMEEADFLEAFEAHPMIGNVDSLKAKFANTQNMASHEQQGATNADDSTLQELHAFNHKYLEQNGFIFIICATGLSAFTMLEALKARIHNTKTEEIHIAAQQQIKITLLRLEKNL